MTEDEKRQQKGLLLLEYQEAQQNLAHLKEKAYRKVEALDEVRKWIRSVQNVSTNYSPDELTRNNNICTNLDTFRNAMNFDDVLLLMDEIKKANQLLETLEKRKADLGLK
jgi:hypothetical protein